MNPLHLLALFGIVSAVQIKSDSSIKIRAQTNAAKKGLGKFLKAAQITEASKQLNLA